MIGRSVRNVLRLLRIARILARHDALFLLERTDVVRGVVWGARLLAHRQRQGRPGQRLAAALEEAGPSFIKMGQALSTRASVSGRGTNTSGPTRNSSPQNTAVSSRCCKGSRSPRLRISSRHRPTSVSVRALSN